MPQVKFDPTVNLGHLLTIAAFVGSVAVAYTSILRSVDNHEIRIEAMERTRDRDAIIQQQILNTLTTIREDIASLKATQSRIDLDR